MSVYVARWVYDRVKHLRDVLKVSSRSTTHLQAPSMAVGAEPRALPAAIQQSPQLPFYLLAPGDHCCQPAHSNIPSHDCILPTRCQCLLVRSKAQVDNMQLTCIQP